MQTRVDAQDSFRFPSAAPAMSLLEGDEAAEEARAALDCPVEGGPPNRRLTVYEPFAVFPLIDELAHLARRAIEPNVFFDPRFLAPAMPRLDDRRVRLMVIRDEDPARSRLRFLMPYSVERRPLFGGAATIRAWSHPFGPLGTLLVDGDDPRGVLSGALATLNRPELGLPSVLVLPNVVADGAMAAALEGVAAEAGLALGRVNTAERAAFDATAGSDPFDNAHTRREVARMERVLARFGAVHMRVATDPTEVRLALEDFLMLEASGWKGRTRSALILDRYRSAFAREAINDLAEAGKVRLYSLHAGETLAASLVVLTDRGVAYAWKTAYDERFATASPGQIVVAHATRSLRRDAGIVQGDSCAMPDHFVMNRFWRERRTVTTLVLGLKPGLERAVEGTVRALGSQHRSRNVARLARERLASLMGRD